MAERVPASAVNITETWSDNALERGAPDNVIPWEDVSRPDRPGERLLGDAGAAERRAARASGVRGVGRRGCWSPPPTAPAPRPGNLEANPRVSFTTRVDDVDVVVEEPG